jgi:thiazole/oxazole-forming peptide maturase SagD family component
MFNNHPSKKVATPGYYSLKEYVSDIDEMQKSGPWRLPLRFIDRLQVLLLKCVLAFSWFADKLYIVHNDIAPPAYSILLKYLTKRELFDTFSIRESIIPGYYIYTLEKEHTHKNGYHISAQARGLDQDPTTALSKAIGELLERVISGFLDTTKEVVRCSPRYFLERGEAVYYPPLFHRFLPIQKKHAIDLFSDDSREIDWVRGINIVTEQKTYVPKQVTSWGHLPTHKEPVLICPTSNGCAGYFSPEGATVRALLEVINRDGFFVHWLTATPPEVVDTATLPDDLKHIVETLDMRGLSVYILNVTSLGVPSVYVVAINDKGDGDNIGILLSGSADVSYHHAIKNALEEVIGLTNLFNRPYTKSNKEYVPFISNLGQFDRFDYWRGKEKLELFSWFIEGDKVSYEKLEQKDLQMSNQDADRLDGVVSQLKQLGEEYYPVVYFPENQMQQELQYWVAQVYIPKAFPLYLLERYGTFDSSRLLDFAHSCGKDSFNLNPMPHMFS